MSSWSQHQHLQLYLVGNFTHESCEIQGRTHLLREGSDLSGRPAPGQLQSWGLIYMHAYVYIFFRYMYVIHCRGKKKNLAIPGLLLQMLRHACEEPSQHFQIRSFLLAVLTDNSFLTTTVAERVKEILHCSGRAVCEMGHRDPIYGCRTSSVSS